MRVPAVVWYLAVPLAYAARPLSCAAVLALEVRPPDQPYHSIDPHGFGVLGAVLGALVLGGPVLWLLLGRRPVEAAGAPPVGRTALILLAIGTPMLMQLTYLPMPLAWSWPIVAASAAWFALVLALSLSRAPGAVSAHAAFDRESTLAWVVLGGVTLLKFGVLLFAFAPV